VRGDKAVSLAEAAGIPGLDVAATIAACRTVSS
jgi:hypothetical protein